MSTCHHCGCEAARCGCCEGVTTMTPVALEQRPGLPALVYRVGTHGRFLASMRARLPQIEVVAPGADHQTLETFRPLRALTTRDPADPAIAMLDAWATVADVLTFYQERIANEGYVRTATERRSLVELSRLVGYAPRPGVSSSVYLSYTVDDNQHDPVEIPIGTRSQSIPGPGETPQSFETGEVLEARREWNDLQVRRQRPQRITLGTMTQNGTVATMTSLHVAGTETGAQPGDQLVLRFGEHDTQALHWVRRIEKVLPDFTAGRTELRLQPLPWLVLAALPLLAALVVDLVPAAARDTGAAEALFNARALLRTVQLGSHPAPMAWATTIRSGAGVEDAEAIALIETFGADIETLAGDGPDQGETAVSSPDVFVDALLKPRVPQVANTLQLRRAIADVFSAGADQQARLLVDFAPAMKDTYYAAWRGTTLATDTAPLGLSRVVLMGAGDTLFGATAGREPAFDDGELMPPATWGEWSYAGDERADNAFLSKPNEMLAPDALVMVQHPREAGTAPQIRTLLRVDAVETGPRTAYGITADSTEVVFTADWRQVDDKGNGSIAPLRRTRVFAQKAELTLVEEPVTEDVSGQEIELGPLHEALESGRWVIFEGERADIAGVEGVKVSELLMIAGLTHGYDATLPGDRTHTTLRLATGTAYVYKRDTLRIHGNVLAASHGETRVEVLGSGDATKSMQAFELKQPPLTWRPAPTAAGAESTLKVLVNNVEWDEVDTLAGRGPHDRVFVTRTGDDDRTTVRFGNGAQGARPPTGFENLRAEYRSGIGKGGNVRAGQIALMVHRPLGVKEVVNPLAASGGADRETAALIRENAPRSTIALDRLVSVSDYADFTRMYAGIAKADAVKLVDRVGELVHITVAGIDDMTIDADSDLYRNLLASLRTLGDPGLRVQVAQRERVALVLEAGIRIVDGHRWEPVVAEVRATLLDRFGFGARSLGQPALLCEIVAAIQSVRGVDRVDVDSFGGIPEKVPTDRGTRRVLITQEQITRLMRVITGRDLPDPGVLTGNASGTAFNVLGQTMQGKGPGVLRPAQRVEAERAVYERGLLRPAQLAIFTPALPDTLVLNQITD